MTGNAAGEPARTRISRADIVTDSILRTILPGSPRARYRVMTWLGFVVHKLRGRERLESRLRRFNDQWSSDQLRRMAMQIAMRRRLRQHLMSNLYKGRFEALAQTVESMDADEILARYREKRPTILVMCHLGFPVVVLAGLHRLGIEMTTLVSAPLSDRFPNHPATIDVIPTEDHPALGGGALKKSLDCLRAGGMLVIAVDGPRGRSTIDTTFFGHRIALRRGTAVLARISQAAVYPVVGRWQPDGGNLELRLFTRVDWGSAAVDSTDAFEREFCAAACEWFEDYLRREPYDVTSEILHLCDIH